jgi:YebC/PmpR family DNA-binding regulatory protein
MSGHSKWHSIKHKKAATDSKRGKIFTKHAKLIAVAARGGGDPGMNPSLRAAIDNARAENMSFDIIDRAIKKGTGESKESAMIEEVIYEGFGPGGVALYIEALTDNRARTVSNLKLVVSKNGGNLGSSGSVGYMFSKKGVIEVSSDGKSVDDIELAAIDAGADDVKEGDGVVEIYTAPTTVMQVKSSLEKGGIKVSSAGLTYVATTEVPVHDEAVARSLIELIDAVEEDEDVTTVFHNAVFDDEVMEKLAA